jgi:hypothetical protein
MGAYTARSEEQLSRDSAHVYRVRRLFSPGPTRRLRSFRRRLSLLDRLCRAVG